MKNIIINKKTKAIIYSIAFALVFSAGAYMRPAIDLGALFASSLFSTKTTYAAPPSEYEALVNTLWKSERHQAVCKANASATVALQLARKYLEEGEKQSALSNYDLPMTEAVTKTSNYGKR